MTVGHPLEGAVYWEGPVKVELEATLTGKQQPLKGMAFGKDNVNLHYGMLIQYKLNEMRLENPSIGRRYVFTCGCNFSFPETGGTMVSMLATKMKLHTSLVHCPRQQLDPTLYTGA